MQKWWIVGAVYFSGLVIVINEFKAAPLLIELMNTFSVGPVRASWIMAAFVVTGVLLTIPAVTMLSQMGPSICGIIGLSCVAAGCFIGGTAATYANIVVGRMTEGLGLTVVSVSVPTILAMYFDRENVKLPIDIWTTAYPVGCILAYILSDPVTVFFNSWRGNWWVGGLAALLALAVYFTVVERPDVDLSSEHRYNANFFQTRNSCITAVIHTRNIWLIYGVFLCMMIVWLGFNIWAPTYLVKNFGYDTASAGSISCLGFIGSVLGGIFGRWLTGKIQQQQSLLLFISVSCCLIISSAAYMIPGSMLIPYLAVSGFCVGIAFMVISSLMPHFMNMTTDSGVYIHIGTGVLSLAVMIAAPLFGVITQGMYWQAAVLPSACISLISLLMMILLLRRSDT